MKRSGYGPGPSHFTDITLQMTTHGLFTDIKSFSWSLELIQVGHIRKLGCIALLSQGQHYTPGSQLYDKFDGKCSQKTTNEQSHLLSKMADI